MNFHYINLYSKYLTCNDHVQVTTDLIENLHEWIGNHPQVMNLLISKDTLLVPDYKRPEKKIRVSKLLLQITIRELQNDLISESSI